MKKLLALLLAMSIVLGLCACGGSGSGSGEEELTADGRVKLSIGVPTDAYIMDYDDNALTNWVEEKCGVELEFIEYAGGTDVATQIATTISARQELPDILYGIALENNTIERYGKEGYLVDVSKWLTADHEFGKIFVDRLQNELTEDEREYVLRVITTPESEAVYAIPTIETSLIDKMKYMLWVNTKLLEKTGLSAPTNNDELLAVLRAFKNNGVTLPLYGSQKSKLGANVVTWLINLFTYFNPDRPYTVSEDGKTLSATFVSDEYREALKFINTLYKEGLLNDLAWSANSSELKQVTTPASGEAMCGIFAGHLTVHATEQNMMIADYAPLYNWGCAVRSDIGCTRKTFITADCSNPEKAFEVLMTLFSKDGSMRIRYGEYGVNWTDPDEGAKSDLGLDATYKLISDPLVVQNTAVWGPIASTLNIMAEGETAQVAEDMSEWHKLKSKMHAEANTLFEKSVAENNPEYICPVLRYTEEEKEQYEMVKTNVGTYYSRAQTDFCKGLSGFDPYNDADWDKYLKELEKLGLADYMKSAQTAYDRG